MKEMELELWKMSGHIYLKQPNDRYHMLVVTGSHNELSRKIGIMRGAKGLEDLFL